MRGESDALFMSILILSVGIMIFRIIKRKSLPSNQYTPFDNMIEGKGEITKQDTPTQDTKHQINYDEMDNK